MGVCNLRLRAKAEGDSVNRSARNKIARPRDDNRPGPLAEFRPMNIYLND